MSRASSDAATSPSWKFTLPDNATLEQVREKALETIDNLDGDKVAGLVKKLTEE